MKLTKPQDAIAKLVLAEIEDEKRWDEVFAGSQDKLADMAAEAIAEHKAGNAPSRWKRYCDQQGFE